MIDVPKSSRSFLMLTREDGLSLPGSIRFSAVEPLGDEPQLSMGSAIKGAGIRKSLVKSLGSVFGQGADGD